MSPLSPSVGALLNQSNSLLGLPGLPAGLFKPPVMPGMPTSATGGVSYSPGAAGSAGSPLSVIRQWAPKYGLDPAAVMAYALEESNGRWNAVGDQGTSYGPFQFHRGGALGNQTAAWAESPAGLIAGMRMMSQTPAKGLTGAAAVRAIYQYFGKGTPLAVPRGLARYGEAQRLLAAPQAASQPPVVNVGGHQYVNPIPPGSVRNRTDQGVDFQTPVGSRIPVIGDAQVVSVTSDPGGFGQMIVYRLLTGPMRGQEIFVGHTTALVRPGQTLRAGQAVSVAKYTPGSSGPPGWVEMGYAAGGRTQAQARGELGSGHADTLSGRQFLALLRALGLKA